MTGAVAGVGRRKQRDALTGPGPSEPPEETRRGHTRLTDGRDAEVGGGGAEWCCRGAVVTVFQVSDVSGEGQQERGRKEEGGSGAGQACRGWARTCLGRAARAVEAKKSSVQRSLLRHSGWLDRRAAAAVVVLEVRWRRRAGEKRKGGKAGRSVAASRRMDKQMGE